jgi:recombination protein RecA
VPRQAPPETPDEVLALVQAEFGAGSMVKASDPSLVIQRIPCGILSVDYLLGGGFPRGRHVEISGGYSVGKSSIALNLVASAQEMGLTGAYVDLERSFDPEHAETQGVDTDSMPVLFPEDGESAVDMLEILVRSAQFDVLIVDSISALVPRAEIEGRMADIQVAAQARLMSKAMRKLTVANKQVCIVYINQLRETIGGMSFGKRTVTSGGKAMGYYAGTRLEVVRIESIKRKGKAITPESGVESDKDLVRGHRVLIRAEKDKTGGASPQETTTAVYDYDLEGFDPIEDVLFLGRQLGLLKKNGANWWIAGNPKKYNGRPAFKKFLAKHPEVVEELTSQIMEEAPEDEDDE